MTLLLSSDFPSSANEIVIERIRNGRPNPTVAWIPPYPDLNQQFFAKARKRFQQFGLGHIECVDIGLERDDQALDSLSRHGVIYLSGGDPLRFRENVVRAGLRERVQACLGAGAVIIGASGGSMQLTPNVSLYRLTSAPLEVVLGERESYQAMGIVDFEFLPHLNRLHGEFLDLVRQYSEQVSHEIVAVADGGVVVVEESRQYVDGDAELFVGGTRYNPRLHPTRFARR